MVIVGILAVVPVFVVAALHFKMPSDVTAATTASGGVIAALVGSYFGLRGATAAQGMAQQMMRQHEAALLHATGAPHVDDQAQQSVGATGPADGETSPAEPSAPGDGA